MINYIKIEGYKSIKKMEIELTPINVLIGSNGSGKSNFLSFFKLVRAIFNKQLQHFVMEEKADNLLYFGRKSTEHLNGKILFSNDAKNNNAYNFRLSPTQDGDLFIDFEGLGYNVLKEDDGQNYTYNNAIKESKIGENNWSHGKSLADYLAGIQVYHFHDTSSNSWLRKSSDVEDNKMFKPDGRNLAAFLYKLKHKHPIIYNRIHKTVQSVAPFIYDFILEPSETIGREETIELRWIDKNDLNTNFSAHHFSDGTIRFIALATVLLQPFPPSIIIIDEPELGLHPLAISKLAGMIQVASQKAQIIISTQSVTLVDCFSAEEIITVDRDEKEKQSTFKRLKSEQFKIWLTEHSLGELWERNIINAAQPFSK
ncbi:MAG: AAA family ATPase [Cryomorphaceae bacterium]|nr:AAA family ATPase [Cryomorphaceae bacterium]